MPPRHIGVLNAGSSSIKFAVRRGWTGAAAGVQGSGGSHRRGAAPGPQGRRRRPATRAAVAGCRVRPCGRHAGDRRCHSRRSWVRAQSARSDIAWCTAAPATWRPSASTRPCWPTSRRSCRWRRSISRTIWRPSAPSRRAAPDSAAGGLLRHQFPCQPATDRAPLCPAPRPGRGRGSAVRLSRDFLRIRQPTPAFRRPATRGAAGWLLPTWAMAPACARCATAGVSRPPWASPPWRAW